MQYTSKSTLLGIVLLCLAACGGGSNDESPAQETNSAPISMNDSANVTFQGEVSINVLTNDSDPNNDNLTITNLTQPSSGSVSILDNQILYEADDASGDFTFTYTANDGSVDSSPATVTVSVAANSVPISVADSETVILGQSTNIDVLVNDSDANGHSLSVEIVSQPIEGSVSLTNEQITYTSGNASGEYTFEYRVFDGFDYSDNTIVTVLVSPATLTLTGKVIPATSGLSITASFDNDETNTSFSATTDENGEFSIGVEVENFAHFIDIEARQIDGNIYHKSNIGTAGKLFNIASDQSEVNYQNYLPLELSSFNTALSMHMFWRNSDGIISDDIEMETLRSTTHSRDTIKLSAQISEILKGNRSLPVGISGISDLFNNAEVARALINSTNETDYELPVNSLFSTLSNLDARETEELGESYFYDYTNEPEYVSFYQREVDNSATLTNIIHFFTSVWGYDRIAIDLSLSWELTHDNIIRMYPSLGNSNPIQLDSRYIIECSDLFNRFLSVDEINLIPIYSGDAIKQYIVQYSGTATAGTSFDMPCADFENTNWSYTTLVTTKTSEPAISETISTGKIATRVGKIFEATDRSTSASLVNIREDNTFTIEANNSSGLWSIDESGALILSLTNGTEIKYRRIGISGLSTNYVAIKTYSDNSKEIFTGIMLNVDNNLIPNELVGRYEHDDPEYPQFSFALSFQENGLGQQQLRDPTTSDWVRAGSSIFDLYYYRWSTDDDGLGLTAEYHVKVEQGNFINESTVGCTIDDPDCYVWRKRDIRKIAEDENYSYLMVNIFQDFEFTNPGGITDTFYSGYVRAFKKTDFVLPPIE